MSQVSEDIAKSLNVAVQQPLDGKTFFNTLAELKDLGAENHKAFYYHEGMEVYVLETNKRYRWKEIAFGETGQINQSYAYPPNTIHNGINYSGRYFNFVEISGGFSENAGNLFYIEPSVNIEIKESETPEQAMYFGKLDMGAGIVDVALVKNTFVSQSGFDVLATKNIGAEIKMINGTNNSYLGHFTISNITFDGYRVLNIIEKGNWNILADYNVQQVFIHVVNEAPYTVSLSGTQIRLRQGNADIGSVDIGPLVSASTATITGATLNPANGIVTFSLSDSSSFQVDFSDVIIADDFLEKETNVAVKGKDVYENLFVTKSVFASFGKGFYAADLTTNYNATSILGFPYPANRDFILLRYASKYYMLVLKSLPIGRRFFSNPNAVLGFSFFKYRTNGGKSMKKLGYLKILSRKMNFPGLNSNYWAFHIWDQIGEDFPLATSSGNFNELDIVQGVNEADAYPMVTQLYEEKLPLRKQVSLPYTVNESDNGMILYLQSGSNSALTVPLLPYGFECGIVQLAPSERLISIVAGTGASILKKPTKSAVLDGQYATAYLSANFEHSYTIGVVAATVTTEYLLSGDLKDI